MDNTAVALEQHPLFADAAEKLRRGNQLLFSRESLCLQPLLQCIRLQNRRTLVLWALTCAEGPAASLQARYPADPRPRQAMELATAWAAGTIKMPIAKKGILSVHAMAREVASPADAALCHAVGHGCAAVHTEAHAIGLPIYELTAIVRSSDETTCIPALQQQLANYEKTMLHCRKEAEEPTRSWADFLRRDNRLNAEQQRLMRSNHPQS